MAEYVHPDVLVSTQWVADNLNDPNIKIVESDEDVLLYEVGHVENAIKIDWQTDLQDQLVRDYIDKEKFEQLLSDKGISNDSTIVFYGDKSNWWACYAMWVFKLFGHEKCLIMNGGRQKWIEEERPITKDVPDFPKTDYKVSGTNEAIRAFRDDVVGHIGSGNPLIDVRSPKEFSGELLHMEAYPQEGALRGGHIPGAANVPWATAANEDGTFKSADELKAIYMDDKGLKEGDDIIAYCRIGERSSHTWFVLTYLLGFEGVRNYDGSWTEWGNLVKAPIEK
ncbi:MAG: sulfurtransferase [Thermodesulfobacteriota bacterium]